MKLDLDFNSFVFGIIATYGLFHLEIWIDKLNKYMDPNLKTRDKIIDSTSTTSDLDKQRWFGKKLKSQKK